MNLSIKRRFTKPWVLVLSGMLLLLVIGVFSARPIISSKMEGILTEKLKERGLTVEWDGSSWNPLHGQHFSGLRISEEGVESAPIAEIESINLQPSFRQYLGSKKGALACGIDSSPLILRDGEGKVQMDDVSLEMSIKEGRIGVDELVFNRDGLLVDLEGEVLLQEAKDEPGKFRPNLKSIRTVFDILDIKGAEDAFNVSGVLNVDASKAPIVWDAKLKGSGKDLEWNGVRWTEAEAEGELSSGKTQVTYDLKTAHGSAVGEVRDSGEEGAPFEIDGKVSDNSGGTNEYHADLLDGVLTVDSIEGSANILELSRDVVGVETGKTESVSFEAFPHIEVKNLKRKKVKGEAEMTIESISVNSSEAVRFKFEDRTVEATDYSASGNFDGKSWIVEKSKANLLGGSVTLKGSYREGALRKSRLGMEALRVEEVRRLFGADEGESSGSISGNFNGAFYFEQKDWEGSGFLRMTDAPVVQVPLLDQVYEIFMAVIPGVKRAEAAEFEADFTKKSEKVEVTRFEAKGGKSLVVTADGEVDLEKGRVQGKASGELQGLPGMITSPVTKLLKMEVSGPYDDIGVKPLGPVELVSGAVEGAVETLKDAGKQTGEAIKEGLLAPLEKIGGGDDESEE
ncbi:hypothetical protein [Luteolibacter sp. AS25]|uniref:hypothetical protein n=1 Tax=Luteolibacter sp. AS25 TaxID=3135776 RepID=UPI00398B2947